MNKDLNGPAEQFADAQSMQAVGFTEMPRIGKVADKLRMLRVPVPRPAKRNRM